MTETSSTIEVFLDFLPNQPKNDQSREQFVSMLRLRLEERLQASVERIWDLPSIILKRPQSEYVALLVEARDLYVSGNFYSCVAMCGIVGERIIKDVLRASVRLEKDGVIHIPQDKAFDQLEYVEVAGIIRFLKEAELIAANPAKAAEDLGKLRNRYAHARGKNPDRDALEAIKLLHSLIEGTVSMFNEFEIKDGVFVRKPTLVKL